jgi:two-component system, chemotaxis family, chemotaxis protein CheY
MPSRWQGACLTNDILIVDDQEPVRITLRELLQWHEFTVCGEAANGTEALEKVRQLKPGIVLLDIVMPEQNGIQTAYEIRRVAPSTKIVFFTVHNSQDIADAAHAIGHAVVSKYEVGTELIPTLNRLIAAQVSPRKTQ